MNGKEKTILCILMATVFLIPLIGNTAVADTTIYHFSEYNPFIAWPTNPEYMVDGNESTFASTKNDDGVQQIYGPLTAGAVPDTITKVEIRAKGNFSGDCYANIILQPIFRSGDGDDHVWNLTTSVNWSPWYDITSDTNAPDPWTVDDIATLKVNVTAVIPICPRRVITVYCSMVQLLISHLKKEQVRMLVGVWFGVR